MVYQNKAGASREKSMYAAYILVTEFGWTQVAVANGFQCSQATIHQWVKEIGYRKMIHDLTAELNDARQLALSLQASQ